MTAIEIVNLALSDCGVSLIQGFDDGSRESIQAKAKYGAIKDAVLEDREWTFAKQRLSLVKDPVAPVFGYSFRFILPSNVLRVIRVYDQLGSDGGSSIFDPLGLGNMAAMQITDWVREGYFVLTNEDAPIFAEVLVRVDEGTFSPGMVLALAARLTAALAIPLTENRQLAKDFMDNYQALIKDAAAMDGSQGRTQRLRPPPMPGRRSSL